MSDGIVEGSVDEMLCRPTDEGVPTLWSTALRPVRIEVPGAEVHLEDRAFGRLGLQGSTGSWRWYGCVMPGWYSSLEAQVHLGRPSPEGC